MKEIQLEGLPKRATNIPIGPKVALIKPIISGMRAPPPAKPIHRERITTIAVPLEIAVESSSKLAGTCPMATIGGGDLARPFTLKNLEAPRKFSELKHSAATM